MTTSRLEEKDASVRFQRGAVRFRCPFCTGQCVAGYAKHPETGQNEPSVAHTMPTCARYDALDPIEFVEAVNSKLTVS